MLKNIKKITFTFLVVAIISSLALPTGYTNTNSTTNISNTNKIIAKNGDYNSTVKEIEKMLNSLGYDVGVVSNWFNTTTKHAVMKFQMDNNLPVSGEVDQITYNLLLEKAGSKTSTPSPKTEDTNIQENQTTTTTETKNTPVTNSNVTTNKAPVTQQTIPGLTADEQYMLEKVNTERANAGLGPLQVDMNLVKTARMKSQDMIDNNYFAHQSPTYGSPFALMRTHGGVTYGNLGENLAGGKTVDIAMTNFMKSPTHRDNILNPKFTHIGIGIVNGGQWSKMYTQHFGGN